MNRIRRLLPVALIAMAITLGGCGVQTDTAENVRDAVGLLPNVKLGTLPVHIDEEGRIDRVGGVSASAVDALVGIFTGGTEVGSIPIISTDYVQWFTDTNVQHITVATREEGLFVLVNGEPLPYLAWDDESIDNLTATIEKFERDGQGAYLVSKDLNEVLATSIPVLPKLGLALRFEFPRQDGAERIPAPSDDEITAAMEMADEAGPALTLIDIDIEYEELADDQGWVPAVQGFSTIDLRQVLSTVDRTIPRYRLRRDIERRLIAEDIGTMGMQARHDGLYLVVDGERLPNLAWNETTLTNLSTLLGQIYPPDRTLPKGVRWVPAVRASAPMLNDLDVALSVNFPIE